MSNYNNLKTTIDANIKQNGNQEITGPILNSVLNQMVNILGTGYQFAGVATLDPATEPGTPDAKVFYIANGKGTYTNFGGLEVMEDDVVILYWDTAWHKVATGIASQEKLSELEKTINGESYTSTEHLLSASGYAKYLENLNLEAGTKIKISLEGTAVFAENLAWLYNDSGVASASRLGGIYVQNNNEYEITLTTKTTFIGLRVYTLSSEGTVTLKLKISEGIAKVIGKVDDLVTPSKTSLVSAINDAYNHGVDIDSELNPQTATNVKASGAKVTADNFMQIKNYIGFLNPEWEMGNISISTSGWVYKASNSRVRLKQGTTLHLQVGDEIRITGNIRFYLGWRIDETYYVSGWKTGNMIITQEGDYVINTSLVPETELTSISQITDNIKVVSVNGSDAIKERLGALELNNDYNNVVKTIAHRGMFASCPENTIVGFKTARKNGYTYCETDVKVTSDGVLVLSHDATINRCARNADGTTIASTISIATSTYDELLQYDFGIYMGEAFKGEKIPTFTQFLTLCRNVGIHPYIELKCDEVNAIVEAVNANGMRGKVTYISTSIVHLRTIHQLDNKARLGLIAESVDADKVNNLVELVGDNEVFIDVASYSNAEVELCKASNLPMEAWNATEGGVIVALTPARIIASPTYISGYTTNELNAGKILFDNSINL